jgi:hypothetical protein
MGRNADEPCFLRSGDTGAVQWRVRAADVKYALNRGIVDAVLTALLARVGRVRVTLLYAAALAVVAAVLLHLGPRVQSEVVRHVSTNLHNLGQGRIATLVASAFVSVDGPIYIWLPGLVAMLALGELLWRSRRMAVAFVIGHVGATLIVAAGLAAALAAGLLSTSIAYAADVGMSYGAVGVLGTFTAAIPPRWRAAWIGWWLAVAAGSAILSGGYFTNAGHGIALILGMVLSRRFGQPERWTAMRWALLAVAAAFGYVVVGYNELSIPTTGAFGLMGALAGWAWTTAIGQRGLRRL